MFACGTRIPGRFELGNLESWALESGIPLTIVIQNPRSTDKEPRNWCLESRIHSVESRSKTVLDYLTWSGTSFRPPELQSSLIDPMVEHYLLTKCRCKLRDFQVCLFIFWRRTLLPFIKIWNECSKRLLNISDLVFYIGVMFH